MVSPAGRAAGSAIDSRKDIVRQPCDNRIVARASE